MIYKNNRTTIINLFEMQKLQNCLVWNVHLHFQKLERKQIEVIRANSDRITIQSRLIFDNC